MKVVYAMEYVYNIITYPRRVNPQESTDLNTHETKITGLESSAKDNPNEPERAEGAQIRLYILWSVKQVAAGSEVFFPVPQPFIIVCLGVDAWNNK